MDQLINQNFDELEYSIYFLTIEDVKIIIRTDVTFVMPKINPSNDSYINIHHHTDNELFFITDGELHINLESNTAVYKNCIVYVPQFTRHYSKATDNIYRFMLSFEKKNTSKHSAFYNTLEKFFSLSAVKTFNLNASIKSLLKELGLLLKSNCLQKNARVTSLLTCIILELIESNTNAVSDNDETFTYDYINHLEHILNNVCNKDVSLEYVAEQLSLSTKQVSRIIRKNYHATFTEVVNEKKLSAACLLLKNTDFSMSKIMELVNIKTENYFYTLFKKRYGMSPLKYRKLNSENN